MATNTNDLLDTLTIDAILIHLKRLAIEGEQDTRGHHCIARNKCNAIIDSITLIQKQLRINSTQCTNKEEL